MRLSVLFGLSLMTVGLAAVSAAPAWAGGGGGRGGGPCSGFSTGNTLIMRDSCFDGVAHFAERGARLTIHNEGEYPHTFTAVDGSFDTGILSPGETADIQLGDDGIVKVVCTLHGTEHGIGMTGVLLVGDPVVGQAGTLPESADAASTHFERKLGSGPSAGGSRALADNTAVAWITGGGLLSALLLVMVLQRRDG